MTVPKMILAIVIAFFICYTVVQYDHQKQHLQCVALQQGECK